MSELYLELFEKYTQNQLTETEKMEFESKLIHDAGFKKDFEEFRILQAGIRLSALKDKLDMIKNHAANHTTQQPDKPKSKWWLYGIYFVITLVILGVTYYVLNTEKSKAPNSLDPDLYTDKNIDNATPSMGIDSLVNDTINKKSPEDNQPPTSNENNTLPKKEIYANVEKKEYFNRAMSIYTTPKNLAVILRDAPTKSEVDYQDALTLYMDRKYQNALAKLAGANDEKSNYLRAHCLLLTGQSQKSIEIFRNIAQDDFSNFYEDAKWYLAIALYANYPDTKAELNRAIIDLEKTNQRKSDVTKLKSLLK